MDKSPIKALYAFKYKINKETKLKNTIYHIYKSAQIQKNEDFYKAMTNLIYLF